MVLGLYLYPCSWAWLNLFLLFPHGGIIMHMGLCFFSTMSPHPGRASCSPFSLFHFTGAIIMGP